MASTQLLQKNGRRLTRTDTMETLREESSSTWKSNISDGNLKGWENECFPEDSQIGHSNNLTERALERSMTRSQEILNAISMFPGVCYCLYFILSGQWQDADSLNHIKFSKESLDGCLTSRLFPNLYARPPWPVIACAFGMAIHAPVAILYHLYCAFELPPGISRLTHWTRKLDQCFIHILAIFWSYASSGSFNYMLVSTAINVDSIFRLYKSPINPSRSLLRMIFAVIIFILPFLFRGELVLFSQFCLIYATGGYMFATYRIGGWSHTAFHTIFTLGVPMFIQASARLHSCQEQVAIAAQCKMFIDPQR